MKKEYKSPETTVLLFETNFSILIESASQGEPGDEGDARPRGFSEYEYSSSNRSRSRGQNGGCSKGWGSLW